MIMPFLRLVIIYIVVILAAVLFFKRDSVMSLLGMSQGGADAEIAATMDAPVKVTEPAAEAPETAEVTNETVTQTAAEPEATEAGQPSKYPTEETAQTVAPEPEVTAPAKDIESRLEEARQAYWNRDLEGAEALYKSLVADAPTNADIKGELGNLYYGMRRMGEAADMFHQTGLQLIADGNTRQIMPLIGVLQSIAPDRANDLRNRLSQ